MAEKADEDLADDRADDREDDLAETDLEALADMEVGEGSPNGDAKGPDAGEKNEPGTADAAGPGEGGGEGENEDEEMIGEEFDLDVDNLDFGDNFEADEDDEEGGNKKPLIIIAASLAGLLVLGGGAWFIFSGGDDPAGPPGETGVPRVVMELPPKGGKMGMLSPPGKGGAGGGALQAVPTTAAATGIVIPAVTMAAFAGLPDLPPNKPVREELDPALVEQTKTGPLPKVGPDGRKPWKTYARVFDGKDARPRIAIIVTGMGLSRAATEAAVSRLPGEVTLAFTPYAQALNDWGAIARRSGHEVLLSLPMESATFPIDDPGPLALMSEVSIKENQKRLNIVLSQMGGYVGVISQMGTLLSKDTEKLRPILEILKSRGLMFIDNGAAKKTLAPKLATSVGVPRAMADVALDRVLTPAAIDAKLTQLERIARERAATVATTGPYPLVLKRLSRWIKTLPEKKIALAPISALADVQFIQ